ncbi:MAG: hypothetical protein KTR25_01140 [Myxococcales bacterium]|nr:hypothetical protein [Myxococcales bacterium]
MKESTQKTDQFAGKVRRSSSFPLEMTTCTRSVGFIIAFVVSVACDPELGDNVATRCVNEDSDPSKDVAFRADILSIFEGKSGVVNCSCHFPDEVDPIGIEIGGLDLSSYEQLRQGGNNSRENIVIEGLPCESYLLQKLGPNPPFGSRMPFDGPPMLGLRSRQLIADWIAEGAKND